MIEVIYTRDNGEIEDLRFFRSEEEFNEWLEIEKTLCPDVEIIKKETLS